MMINNAMRIPIALFVSIGFSSSLPAADGVQIEGETVEVKTLLHKHSFSIQEKLEDASFWILSAFQPPVSSDSIISFYACAAEMTPAEHAPKSQEAIELFEEAKKRQVLIDEGTEEGRKFKEVMGNCKNYFLIPDSYTIRNSLKKLEFKDTITLSGYLLKYNQTEMNNKPVNLAASVAQGPFILVTEIQLVQ